jgi:hypothetical protein
MNPTLTPPVFYHGSIISYHELMMDNETLSSLFPRLKEACIRACEQGDAVMGRHVVACLYTDSG